MSFKINEKFAKDYNERREQEEKRRLKAKYGDVDINDDETTESSSTEDEDAEELTPAVEKGWLKTLAALKSRDPSIYDPNTRFYESTDEESSGEEKKAKRKKKKKEKKEKPMTLKDYEREVMLEKDGKFEDTSDEDAAEETEKPKGYYEEQKAIKASFKEFLASDESDEDILTEKQKSKDEKKKEEASFFEFLKGNEEANLDEKTKAEIKPLKDYWNDPNLNANDAFLRDYFLNKRYLAKSDDEDGDKAPGMLNGKLEDNDEEDDEIFTKQENFERDLAIQKEVEFSKEFNHKSKYTFHFQEPNAAELQTYPRNIEDSKRLKVSKRKEKRKARAEKKAEEKAAKLEEIKQLRNIKKRELMSKMSQLKEVTGKKDLPFKDEEMEEEFDPEKHDQMMQRAFDDDYYDDEYADDEKPVFSDVEDDEYGDWQEHGEPDAEGDEAEGGAEADAENPQPSTSYSRKKEKQRFKDSVQREKPVFDPSEKTFEEYLDEYYKLDFEDIIGDQPCRFKYREVVPNDFGLKTEEILTAKPGELNKWVSVKKMSQYRTEEEEQYDKLKFSKMAKKGVQYNVIPSLKTTTTEGDNEGPTEGEPPAKKKKKKKQKNKNN